MKLSTKYFLIAFTVAMVLPLLSCNSSKEITSFEEIKIGNELESATEIALNDFFQIWMSNKQHSKLDENCYELYKDKNFTYFGKNELKGLRVKKRLYKVSNKVLSNNFENYKKVDGIAIRLKFYDEIVPQNDKTIYKESDCSSSSNHPKYSYKLLNNKIETTLKWKFRCDGKKLFENTYKSTFDLNSMKFEK
jgi:uncharacterized lipoprotein YehR (DUF1307 family)